MNIQKFISELPEQYTDWGTSLVKPKVDWEPVEVWRMTTGNIMQLLNFAVSCMEENEIYLEAGILRGASLIAGLKDNSRVGIGVDTWSQFTATGNNKEICIEAMKLHSVYERVRLVDGDIKKFLLVEDFAPVGVFHYDADHDYFEVLASLEFSLPCLSDSALMVIDDMGCKGTMRAVSEFTNRYSQKTSEHGKVETLDVLSGEGWWNGVAILAYDGSKV